MTMMDRLLNGGVSPNQERKEDIREAVKTVFDTASMKLKAVIKRDQLVPLARLAIYADYTDSHVAHHIFDALLELSVSVDARGRSDMTKMLQSQLAIDLQGGGASSIKEKLLGIR